MPKTVLIAEDDRLLRSLFYETLITEGYHVIAAEDGVSALAAIQKEPVDVLLTDVLMPSMDGITLLSRAHEIQPHLRAIVMTSFHSTDVVLAALRNRAIDFLPKPFSVDDLRASVRAVSERTYDLEIQVISGTPDWIEILLPCDITVVEPMQKFFSHLQPNLTNDAREAVGAVFREMLNNAIEHGGKFDITKKVEVKFIRTQRMILYSIKDPGEGFDLKAIEHAAVANPDDNPFRHMEVRKEKGIRPGGFGILLAKQIIDELIYNEKHNQLIFIKYLDDPLT